MSGSGNGSISEARLLNVAEISASLQRFGLVDYLVFIMMLVVCAIIGFYFGFIERKQKKRLPEGEHVSEAVDYLVGGRQMKVLPVSLSLVASFVSGISLLGTSTEVYVYGTQYAFILITTIISGIISWYVFLPVFCNLQLTSTYEYFEMRYDKTIRLMGSIFFTIATVVWLPIVIYVPALAFNQVTGINLHIITPIVCLVCIFYTCVGGLKAVVCTDVIQTVIMVGAILLISIKGTIDVGGIGVVWQRNFETGRIELPALTWDPTERASMLSIFLGSTLYTLQCQAGNQNIIQRFLALPSMHEVGQAACIFIIGITFICSVCFYNGLLIFATYHDCDPMSTQLAKAKDQLVPLFVMDLLGIYPGLPGLFVAAVFSAALSSLSTGLNSLSAVVLEDFIKPLRKVPLSERQTAIILRASVLIFGTLCVGLVFVVEQLGTVLQVSMALGSVTMGPLLGLFLMGVLLPWINGKSALVGSVIAFAIVAWISTMAQLALVAGDFVYAVKPVSTSGCQYAYELLPNISLANSPQISRTFFESIYHMSFMFYVAVGSLLTIWFSVLASFFYGLNDPSEMDINLFSPFVRKLIKSKVYASVSTDEKLTMDVKKIDT